MQRVKIMVADNENEVCTPGLEKYVKEFYEDRSIELVEMRASLQRDDLSSLRNIAHKWKGFCRPYGFGRLEALGKELEQAASQPDVEGIDKILAQVEDYLREKAQIL